MKKLIDKWNALNNIQKAEFGDRFITHDTDLIAWQKEFKYLSPFKKELVIQNIEGMDLPGTMIGTGIKTDRTAILVSTNYRTGGVGKHTYLNKNEEYVILSLEEFFKKNTPTKPSEKLTLSIKTAWENAPKEGMPTKVTFNRGLGNQDFYFTKL